MTVTAPLTATEPEPPRPGTPTPDTTEPEPPRRPSRWWIAAVPFAIALMLAASGYRVQVFWFEEGQHRPIASADAGEWAAATGTYTDAHGETSRTYAVRFAGLGGESTAYEDSLGTEVVLAEGMVARTVDLEFEAAPDQALTSCTLTLVDDRGRRYSLGGGTSPLGDPVHGCVPADTPGPRLAVLSGDERGATPEGTDPRPGRWTTSPAIAVPKGARLVELRVSFEDPDYVSLTLEP
ncbi:MAG TPA: hypothetical protein VLQ78_05670 [Ornithinibacter sp.]|nr:hypothetical protein [Ornithinibacter sp.]